MYYVYVLQSNKSLKLYKGCSSNLKKRLDKHNAGGVKSTKGGVPWKLIYYQGFLSKSDALREEKFLKSGKGRDRIKLLLKNTLKT